MRLFAVLTATASILSVGFTGASAARTVHGATRVGIAASTDPWLWASGQLDNAVVAYDLAQSGYPAVASITQGVSAPAGITLDAHGTLYIVNNGNATVTEYPAGQSSPSTTLTGLSDPIGVAVDVNGDVYVTNVGAPSAIVVFKAGHTKPSRYITDRHIQVPCQIFFDAARTLYLMDVKTGASTMAYGTRHFTPLHLKRLGGQPVALAQGPTTGELYEGDAAPGNGFSDRARAYAPGKQRPAYSMFETVSVHWITVGSVGSEDIVFVPAYGTELPIYLFHLSRRQPFAVLSNGLHGINGVAFKPANVP